MVFIHNWNCAPQCGCWYSKDISPESRSFGWNRGDLNAKAGASDDHHQPSVLYMYMSTYSRLLINLDLANHLFAPFLRTNTPASFGQAAASDTAPPSRQQCCSSTTKTSSSSRFSRTASQGTQTVPPQSNARNSLTFSSAPPVSIDQIVSDFDGVTFHISTPNTKTQILVSLSVKCYKELVQYGAEAVLEREYGPYIVAPEQGYDFSLQVDLDTLPAEQDARDDLVRRISLLKRNAMAAPFEQAFDEYAALHTEASKYTSESAPAGMREGGEVRAIHYREEEAIYIKASFDRVTVIFSTVFREETDRIFGKVFLQEFVDARRRAIQNAPQVLFRNDPPLELQGVPGLPTSGTGEVGYITFGETNCRSACAACACG